MIGKVKIFMSIFGVEPLVAGQFESFFTRMINEKTKVVSSGTFNNCRA